MGTILEYEPKIQVGSAVIRLSPFVHNLGALFDKYMDMSAQVNYVSKSMYYYIRMIGKVRCHLDKETCIRVVNALVTSRLDFNNGLLTRVPDAVLSRLQFAQNAAARMITRTKKYDHISPVLRSLHWLPVKDRIVFKILLLVYKVMHNLSPPDYLVSMLVHHTSVRDLRSSSKPMWLSVPRVKKSIGDRAFSTLAPKLWNSFSDKLRLAPSLATFKKHLKTLLFK
jgi:hypothetical protein